MMISPEGYYEMELKGKSIKDIAKKIRSLKNEIGHLKKAIESPKYGTTVIIMPDEHTRLWYIRLYLARAIAAYEEAGGTYQPSKAEQRSVAFDADIPNIIKITFMIGSFFSGHETCTITLSGDHLQMWVEHTLTPTPTNFNIEPGCPITKEELFDGLRDIHIGEWKHHYYDPHILDGTQWELTIEYAGGRKVEYDGSNAYPFSFERFCELIGYGEEMSDEEDE